MRTRVKICGVTSVEDALHAARAGADAVGIIQVPGAKRRVDVGTAYDIASALPPYVTPVLVFANASPPEIQTVCQRTGIRTVQLHGQETVELVLALHGLTVIKKLDVGPTLAAQMEHWALLDRSAVAGLLLEGSAATASADPAQSGGTGKLTDFDRVKAVLDEVDPTAVPPLILAGGLTPENVGTVVRRFHPWAVDTSSGVESPALPLRKDRRRLRSFVTAVHQADHWDDDADELS